jgi:DNA polymerase-1
MRQKSKRLYLIDGNSFCYRAYYAISRLSTSRGEPTNAIYGFVAMLRKLLHEEKPDYLAICFDRKEPTFRHERYQEYKAHRKPMPEDLVEQIPAIKEMADAYRIAFFDLAGYEADDLIGTIARRGEKEGFEIFVVTGDKDALQLVDEQIRVYNTHKEGLIYDRAKVVERFEGLGPEKVVEVMALMGDSSDNIPGVPGIGEKTAIRLIREFGSVDGIYKNMERLKPKPLAESLRENEQIARLSRDLALIDVHVPLEIDWEALRVKPPDEKRLTELFKRFEFRSLLKELTPTGEVAQGERKYRLVADEKSFASFVKALEKQTFFSFDTETTAADPMQAHLVGMSFCWRPFEAFYVPVASRHHEGKGLAIEETLRTLRPILEDPKRTKAGQNIKYDWVVMRRHGVRLRGIRFDTMIASYLANPLKLNHNLDDISFEYLGVKKITMSALLERDGREKHRTMDQVALEKISEYACEDADCVFRLVSLLKTKLEEQGLTELFETVELPLLEVLAQMEMNGVKIDLTFLKKLSEKMARDLEKLSGEIYEEAGEEFNINSTKQLSHILFVKMKIPVVKRTKTGYSTDVSVLEKLAQEHKLPKLLLEYREKSKLKSTYFDALPELVNRETGLIHTSFHQTTTATGRLSSSEPNLQNIPIKTETGREIRKAFVPRAKGRKILSADYSQIELRILAHLSGDANLTQAFLEDRDIHTFTATLLYGVKEKDVTWEMRNVAKTINFSIIYGKTAFGLSQDLGLSISEADEFIQAYFRRYPKVQDYLETQKEKARTEGYLTTILGRRSYFPEIHSKNPQLRGFAERAAVNAPIQGSAADLIKLAMIAIEKELEQGGFESQMIIQVHDELVFDILDREADAVSEVVRQKMEGAATLRVPLKVKLSVGESWYRE